jgi:hypothetical protein
MSSSNTTNFQQTGQANTENFAAPPGYQSSESGSVNRLLTAGISPGGNSLITDIAGKVLGFNFSTADGTPYSPELDWRVRISMASSTAQYFYNNSNNVILTPLSETKGVIFPYTPSITIAHAAKYNNQILTHSNYASYFYESSEIGAIRIQADFTAQNVVEGRYMMAVIHFFRSCTKMFFGKDTTPPAGTPPPLVFLNGFGAAYLPNVPCVVTEFSQTMPKDVDYITVPLGIADNRIVRQVTSESQSSRAVSYVAMPSHCEMIINLQPVYSRKNIADNFSLQSYTGGNLIENGMSPIGGFL